MSYDEAAFACTKVGLSLATAIAPPGSLFSGLHVPFVAALSQLAALNLTIIVSTPTIP